MYSQGGLSRITITSAFLSARNCSALSKQTQSRVSQTQLCIRITWGFYQTVDYGSESPGWRSEFSTSRKLPWCWCCWSTDHTLSSREPHAGKLTLMWNASTKRKRQRKKRKQILSWLNQKSFHGIFHNLYVFGEFINWLASHLSQTLAIFSDVELGAWFGNQHLFVFVAAGMVNLMSQRDS